MARLGVAIIAAAALSVSFAQSGASAADLPVKARPLPVETYSWTGFYIGANMGGAWGRSDPSSTLSCPDTTGPGCVFQNPANIAAVSAAGSPGTLNSSSLTGGLLAGYNKQSGAFLFGAEVDINAMRIRTASSVTAPILVPAGAGPFTVTTNMNADWVATARARIGFLASPNLLLYATGGLAVTRVGVSNFFTTTAFAGANGLSNANTTKAGGVLGGGAEWAINSHWSLRGEYLYMRFDSASTTATVNNGLANNNNLLVTAADLRLSIARAAIAYRF